jgi:thiosulfate dehydrogenase [quinone] large subunit
MAGVDKFRAGDGASATFNMANYEAKSAQIAKLMTDNSIVPAAMVGPYAHYIGFVLLGVGAWVAIGLLSEYALFAAGVTLLSLGFGLAALPDDMELTANIGVGIIITGLALMTNKYGFLSLDGLFGRGRGRKNSNTEA